MRYGLLFIFALALPASAQITVEIADTTSTEGQAALVAYRASRVAEAQATVAWVNAQLTAHDDSTWEGSSNVVFSVPAVDFSSIGTVTISVDPNDPNYVMVDLPLATATGAWKILVGRAIEESIQDYSAQEVGIGKIRIESENAVKFLRRFNAALNP